MIVKTAIRAAAVVVISSLVACAAQPIPEGNALELSEASLQSVTRPGRTRIVFFNDTNLVLWALTHRIVVSLDGRISPRLPSGKFFVVDVDPGNYDLVLEHWDIVKFSDKYEFTVEGADMYVRLFNTTTHTKYEITEELPARFDERFERLN